jgi:hypothetical protein
MGKLLYREIRVPLPLFKQGVIVMVTRDTKRAAANVRKWYNGDFEEWDADSVDGKTLSREGYNGAVIWIRQPPRTPYQLAVLGHEVFHAVARIMDRLKVPLNYTTEETYTYTFEFIYSTILTELRKSKGKKK